MTTEPKITLEWENGVFVSYPIVCASKADAFAKLDALFRGAEFPASIAAVISVDGEAVWAQHGTHVTLNK